MPRIRTIKPEFWRNRALSTLPAFTRLVAIAILNVADDDGYFEADPLLIRGDVFPYEQDYGSITVALRELSGIGYVVFRTCSEKGEIGYIPNFKKHQVINKPGKSKLKEIYENSQGIEQLPEHSGSTTVVIREGYVLEQGTGNREQEQGDSPEPLRAFPLVEEPKSKKKPKPDFSEHPLPREIDTPQMRDAWRMWCKHRKEIGHALTETQMLAQLKELVKVGEPQAIRGIEYTVSRGWQGLRYPDESEQPAAKPREKTQAEKDAILAKVRADRAKEDGRYGA